MRERGKIRSYKDEESKIGGKRKRVRESERESERE